MERNIIIYCLFWSVISLVSAAHIHREFVPECHRDNRTLNCSYGFPESIPEGVVEVIVSDYKADDISSNAFSDTSWERVITLSIETHKLAFTKVQPGTFQTLIGLRNLGLHGKWILIETDTFKGIRTLNTLDLSGCNGLRLDSIIDSLNGSDRVSQLSVLNISQVGLAGGRYNLETRFAEVIGSKNISMLNLSHASINSLNMSALADTMCEALDYVDAASSHVAWVPHFFGVCKSLKRIDLDNVVFLQVLPKVFPVNIQFSLDLQLVPSFMFFSNIDTINANGLWQKGFPKVQNVTLSAKKYVNVKIKNVSLSKNGIEYFDLKFINVSNTIEFLDLSWNRMTYLQPMFMSDGSPMQHLDLSHNYFNEMAMNNHTDFQILLKYFKQLKIVNLGHNKLTHLPLDLFKYNRLIKSIDLADNCIEQIGFDLTYNSNLTGLNLRGNHITILTSDSMQLLTKAINTNKNITVDIRENALKCNTCACKSFIKWVVSHIDNVVTDGVCTGEHGRKESLDKSTVSKIDSICTRATRTAISTSISLVSTIIIISAAVLLVKHNRRKRKAAKVSRVINRIHDGDYHYDFPVFVASSGNDEDFVEHTVMRPLRAHLRDIIGTRRDLICTGDRHFKLGKSIAEETERSCRRCGVVILVISPSFCASTHCNYEAHIAFTLRKPLILMLKEHVPVEEMPPVLRIIFRLYTRVTWKVQEGQYIMSTTWQNVCESILELMVEQPRLNRQDHLEVINNDD